MSTADHPPAGGDSAFTTAFTVIALVFTIAVALMLGMSDSERVLTPPTSSSAPAEHSAASAVLLPIVPLPTPLDLTTPSSTPQPAPARIVRLSETPTSTATATLVEDACGEVPESWLAYIVQDGDTLVGLSAASGATINDIVQANCLDFGVLQAGHQIYLPSALPELAECGPPNWWTRYIVNFGDTLSLLAIRRETTVLAIMQANCLESSNIYAGQLLFLPPMLSQPIATAIPTTSPTPSPTFAATWASSATPTPKATPIPTSTTTGTPESTSTPTRPPTQTPSPSSTPPLTSTPTPSLSPTSTPPPTNTPTPTATRTPRPTATMAPKITPTPIAMHMNRSTVNSLASALALVQTSPMLRSLRVLVLNVPVL